MNQFNGQKNFSTSSCGSQEDGQFQFVRGNSCIFNLVPAPHQTVSQGRELQWWRPGGLYSKITGRKQKDSRNFRQNNFQQRPNKTF